MAEQNIYPQNTRWLCAVMQVLFLSQSFSRTPSVVPKAANERTRSSQVRQRTWNPTPQQKKFKGGLQKVLDPLIEPAKMLEPALIFKNIWRACIRPGLRPLAFGGDKLLPTSPSARRKQGTTYPTRYLAWSSGGSLWKPGGPGFRLLFCTRNPTPPPTRRLAHL